MAAGERRRDTKAGFNASGVSRKLYQFSRGSPSEIVDPGPRTLLTLQHRCSKAHPVIQTRRQDALSPNWLVQVLPVSAARSWEFWWWSQRRVSPLALLDPTGAENLSNSGGTQRVIALHATLHCVRILSFSLL